MSKVPAMPSRPCNGLLKDGMTNRRRRGSAVWHFPEKPDPGALGWTAPSGPSPIVGKPMQGRRISAWPCYLKARQVRKVIAPTSARTKSSERQGGWAGRGWGPRPDTPGNRFRGESYVKAAQAFRAFFTRPTRPTEQSREGKKTPGSSTAPELTFWKKASRAERGHRKAWGKGDRQAKPGSTGKGTARQTQPDDRHRRHGDGRRGGKNWVGDVGPDNLGTPT